ncbi:pre-mRNA-splicing factor SYF1-like [Halichondria panicea]|uniref:pre-mRNA-splicing factor SYF1-like n=1 Tax=Halichondria panicea TaxID=6063 RepID=UPI00312B4AEF
MHEMEVPKDLMFEESDLPHEEEILRHPYQIKCWLRYIEHKSTAPKAVINLIYERALKQLPGSYKLWYRYLKLRRRQVKLKCITDSTYEEVNNAFERALVFLHKMPRIWLEYCQFLMEQCKITRTRRTFDRALRALPLTQHKRVWPLYLKFVRSHDIQEMAVRVYRRFLKLSPENGESYVEYLISIGRLNEAATKLAEIVNDEKFISKEGKSKHQLWQELCVLISKNPGKISSLKVDPIIRGGIRRFTDMIGQLWCSLADYYIRSGHFEKARDIYEESIQTVTTVRDFGQVFDAYAQFEESMINSKMETTADMGASDDDDLDLELRLARFEMLMDRRPFLLSSVLLRQNPHNVHEWLKRVKLYEGKPRDIINTYTEAVQTVDVSKAVGKPHTLWVNFAKFYEDNGQLPEARVIFEKASKVQYRQVDDLAIVWCEYTEMELRHEKYDKALHLMRRATAMPARRAAYHDKSEPVQNRLFRSLKVWSMYADLEESLGTFESTKAVYNRIIDLKIATPQIIINYGLFLEEQKYFEEGFKAYERGVSLFKWPHVYDIWNTYLTKFIKRYGGKKLERARDLFEQALDGCPAKFAKPLYLLYAQLEEDHGLARHAMAVYDRATKAVTPDEQFEMFNIYLKRAAEAFGITHTREIYERAIEILPDDRAREMCMNYAQLEIKLGEIDRARGVFSHGSQMSDPRIAKSYWKAWQQFEVRHGNEDTFREMLRIKRSVQAQFNTQVNFMSAQMLASASKDVAVTGEGVDEMRLLEEQARKIAEEATRDQPHKKTMSFVKSDDASAEMEELARVSANPDEINLGDSDEEEGGVVEEVTLQTQTIPSAVFGSISEEVQGKVLGAKERFAQKKK